jgi:ketosteroid isomerase-like protein
VLKAIHLLKSAPALLALVVTATSLEAQGIADLATGKHPENAAAVYRARVRQTITATLQQWTEAMRRGDSAGAASMYTDNARSYIEDLPDAEKRAEVMTQLFKTTLPGAQISLTIEDFDVGGEMAFVSSLIVAQRPTDPAPVRIRSVFIFRFDDWRSKWQVREQFFDYRAATSSAPGNP